jgi:hypothetical protein
VNYAQLNVLKSRHITPSVEDNPEVQEQFAADIDMLKRVARHVGFSRFEIKLLLKFFTDYVTVAAIEKTDDIMITALILQFAQLNGVQLANQTEIYELLGIDSARVKANMQRICKALGCELFDPRYLTEEAFIRSLYY